MTQRPQHDSLKDLWTSEAVRASTDDILALAEESDRQQRRARFAHYIVYAVAILVTCYLEIQGSFRMPGALFVFLIGSVIWGEWRRRQREKMSNSIGLETPESAVIRAIAETRHTLKSSRMLYAGLPIGVLAGFLAGPLLSRRQASSNTADWIDVLIIVSAVVLIIASVLFGVRLARKCQERLTILNSRRKDLEKKM